MIGEESEHSEDSSLKESEKSSLEESSETSKEENGSFQSSPELAEAN